MGILPDLSRLHDRVARDLVEILCEVTDQRYRDKVEHDRVDHLVRAELCFEDSRDRSPNAACNNGGYHTQQDQQNGWQAIPRPVLFLAKDRNHGAAKFYADPCRCERGDIKLALGTDV